MVKQSRYSREAVELLGRLVRARRIERRLTTDDVATRAGISRALLYRIERGDPTCSIGAVFEVAAIVDVRLFDSDKAGLATKLADTNSRLTLLPKAIRTSKAEVKDDF